MADEISVNFQAIKPSGIKLLNRLYNCHLVLNDIGVRLDDELSNNKEVTVPTPDDVGNLGKTFGKAVQTFTDITDDYGDVNQFAKNFGGQTRDFAEKLMTELIDFNNGISDINDTEGGVAAYDNDKLNDWINKVMGDIVATNESFNKLTQDQAD